VTDDLALPRHDDDDTEHERGAFVVIGGTRETVGAVALAGLAGLRVGAGRLRVATVASAAPVLAVAVPEARVVGLPETADGDLDPSGAVRIGELVEDADAVLIGPGVLHDGSMDALVTAALGHGRATVVVDAGALGALARHDPVRRTVIAVPNVDELAVLGPDAVTAAASRGMVVACRGPRTTVAGPDGRTWEESSGGVGLATSGSGDVVAGIITGLAARGAGAAAAAVWGVRLHARAGERLAARVGRIGFLARELLDELPAVLPR
jgi:ADP-dependent NAD(P)H-hydrate dehydratase